MRPGGRRPEEQEPSQGDQMRVQMTELPVVIRIETPREVVVALPRARPTEDVLTMASLVLSSEEFDELRENLAAFPETAEPLSWRS